VAKKRRKPVAKKRRKQNLAGMDFESLVNLRKQVESALSGHRATLEKHSWRRWEVRLPRLAERLRAAGAEAL
jgi:hypothetical protein